MMPAEPPWLTPEGLGLAQAILLSHQLDFGVPLLPGIDPVREPRRSAQELFAADLVVLAHDGGEDPLLSYANRAALRLWLRSWQQLVGMPSRLTAEPSERAERSRALARAREAEAIRGYAGIRIDARGRRFRMENARLWTVRDPRGGFWGQAAAFSRWWWLG